MILNIRSAITTLQADLTSGFKIWMQQKCPGFCWASAGTWILPMHKQIDRITAYLANIMHNIWVKTIGGNRNSWVQVINVHLALSVAEVAALAHFAGRWLALRSLFSGFAPGLTLVIDWYWYADVRILRSKSERKGTGHPTTSSNDSVRMFLYTVDMYLASTCVWVQLWYAVINYWPTRYCYYRLSQL